MLNINTNISAQNAHTHLLKNDQGLTGSREKLASGLRINRAADDAAGLAISNQLLTQLVGQNQSTLSYGALAAIGKQITATAATAGDPDITGTVTGIQTVNGVTMLNLGDGTSVPLSSVTAVKNPTAT